MYLCVNSGYSDFKAPDRIQNIINTKHGVHHGFDLLCFFASHRSVKWPFVQLENISSHIIHNNNNKQKNWHLVSVLIFFHNTREHTHAPVPPVAVLDYTSPRHTMTTRAHDNPCDTTYVYICTLLNNIAFLNPRTYDSDGTVVKHSKTRVVFEKNPPRQQVVTRAYPSVERPFGFIRSKLRSEKQLTTDTYT